MASISKSKLACGRHGGRGGWLQPYRYEVLLLLGQQPQGRQAAGAAGQQQAGTVAGARPQPRRPPRPRQLSKMPILIARHAERVDYAVRSSAEQKNWQADAERPWDTPITEEGVLQAKALGRAIAHHCAQLQLPPPAQVAAATLATRSRPVWRW
jgi:hypothetical protein